MKQNYLKRPSTIAAPATVILAGVLPACGDNGAHAPEPKPENVDGPLYAMMVQVYGPDDRTVYVSLSDTLDIASTSLETAREFPGVANFAAISGRLFISDGIEPKITEFDIASDHSWIERRSISFADYPLLDNANFYYQFIVDAKHALLPFEGTSRIVWNPAEMAIEKTLDDSALAEPLAGMTMEAGGNRDGVRYDTSVLQAIFYHDEDWYDYGSKSHIIVYDEESFAEDRIIDVPCPALSLATRDESGNTYFSTWDLPTTSLLEKSPATCIAKLSSDNKLLETIDIRDWTEGRVANNFRYVGNDKAFANVLHHEELGVNSPAELDDEGLTELGLSGPHWRLWLFDVEKGTGKPVEGIDVVVASGAQLAVLDGRTFVFVPYDDWGRTKAYELHEDGTAKVHFDTLGDVFKWVRVR